MAHELAGCTQQAVTAGWAAAHYQHRRQKAAAGKPHPLPLLTGNWRCHAAMDEFLLEQNGLNCQLLLECL